MLTSQCLAVLNHSAALSKGEGDDEEIWWSTNSQLRDQRAERTLYGQSMPLARCLPDKKRKKNVSNVEEQGGFEGRKTARRRVVHEAKGLEMEMGGKRKRKETEGKQVDEAMLG